MKKLVDIKNINTIQKLMSLKNLLTLTQTYCGSEQKLFENNLLEIVRRIDRNDIKELFGNIFKDYADKVQKEIEAIS